MGKWSLVRSLTQTMTLAMTQLIAKLLRRKPAEVVEEVVEADFDFVAEETAVEPDQCRRACSRSRSA
jgi:hypothetical protein